MSAMPVPLEPIAEAPQARRPWLARLTRGRAEDQAWVRPAFAAIVVLAAILYIAGLTRSGYANAYYSAAVMAATKSWKAFFFGSVDAGNFITVDKPAGSLWLMDLSARLFGVSSWSILLPEALAGVASVALLFHVVRRSFGAVAGLIAALVMALTPVAVLMFRFNNPDGLLTLLLIAAAWAFMRGIGNGRTRWFLLAALFTGLGFNTKYLQAYLVVPALLLTLAIAGRGSLRRRLMQLLASAGVLLVSSGWWLVIVDLIPASARPYIGGSTNNTVLDLVLGYDGFGRIFGRGGPGPAGGAGANFGGASGLLRLFNSQVGGQVSWLIPFALIALGTGVWLHWRRSSGLPFTGYLFWGLWLLVGAAVFSFSSGIFHSYYTVQLAPAIAALTGAGIVELWRWRTTSWFASLLLAAGIIATAWWGVRLLGRTATFTPWLGPLSLAVAVAAALLLVLVPMHAARAGILARAAVVAGLAAMLAGSTAYSLATVGQAYSGGDPSAGPAAARATAFGGGQGPGGFGGNFRGAFPGGAGAPPGFTPGSAPSGGPPAGVGGFGGDTQVNAALIAYLTSHQGNATWIVAVSGANQAASIELATGKPVMAMGGFIGSDPAPTLAQLKALVKSGQLRYIIIGGGGGGPGAGGGSTAQAITDWVTQHGTQVNYGATGGGTLYDLQ